jgi:CBS domain containing-hemolysin-like protein
MESDLTTLWAAAAGVLLLMVLDLLLTIALVAGNALSHVSLHRLAGVGGDDSILLEIGSPVSRHRTAAYLARQICLLGVFGLLILIGNRLGLTLYVILALAVAALLVVLLVEILAARIITARQAGTALRRLIPLLRVVRLLTWPLLAPVQGLLDRFGTLEQEDVSNLEEPPDEAVEAYFEAGEREGIMEADEGRMMRSIVDLGDTRVREIMTPRTDIEALPFGATVGDARAALLRATHSSMPVFRDSIDSIVGILHLRDLIRAWEQGGDDDPVTAYLRPAFFVPETQMVDDLLDRLRTTSNMALVVDEYGGVAGLVTLEDIFEEIVGDIRDEHDIEEEQIRKVDEEHWLFNGLVHVSELEELFGIAIEYRDYDTVGGLVVACLGRVPVVGETVLFQGLKLKAEEADLRRVYVVRVSRVDGETEA